VPVLHIVTNVELSDEAGRGLLAAASESVAQMLRKPERYVMVVLSHNRQMRFAGSADPIAYLELKSIGLPRDATPALSARLCELARAHLGVAPDRVYVEFADAEPSMWGWNADTF
jgi:phenylpyruvate tautomerase PptA (4-oxalocrotonate tautomerase family)